MSSELEKIIIKFLPDNIRLAKFYSRRLNKLFSNPGYGNTNRLDGYRENIKKHLLSMSDHDAKNTINNLSNDISKYFLIDAEFEWINDEKKSAFVWGWLTLPKNPITSANPALIANKTLIEEIPSNHEDAITKIKKYFDDMQTTNKAAMEIMRDLKSKWDKFNGEFKSPLKWLSNNDTKQCEWAWEFIKDKIYTHFELKPRVAYEYYICTLVKLMLGTNFTNDKKYIISNMSKANSQRKFRATVKDKETVNTYIDRKSKKNLDTIKQTKGMSMSKTIEYLIEKEFISLNKKP